MAEYIEREAAIAVIEEKQKELCPVGMYSRHAVYGSDREKFDAWEEIIEAIEAIPDADVRPVVRGKWTLNKDGSGTCSECGFVQNSCWDLDNWDNFCHHCGADMRPTSMSGANGEEI